jgi:hypothetical protein
MSTIVYYCVLDNKWFDSKMALDDHMVLHEGKRYRCFFCEEDFDAEIVVDEHMKVEHDHDVKKDSFDCVECGERYASPRDMILCEIGHNGPGSTKCYC